MYSLSHLYVAARQDEMRRLAADERLARQGSVIERKLGVGAALQRAWSFLGGPADRPVQQPTLTDYPYRG